MKLENRNIFWWWRKVRVADIPKDLRDRFEIYGENILANAIAGGIINSSAQGGELITLIQQKRTEIFTWLQEKRDQAERKEQRLETLEWAILVFVILGMLTDLALLICGH